MKAEEKYEFGRAVYAYIQAHPECNRAELNSFFRTVNDDKRNNELTDVVLSMLTLEQVKKHLDNATSQVFYWVSSYKMSNYPADKLLRIHPSPTDYLAPFVVPPRATPAPTSPPARELLKVDDVATPEQKVHERTLEKLNGSFHDLYKALMAEPLRVFGKNAPELVAAVPDQTNRSRALGRMSSMGVIRKALDPKVPTLGFYTLEGQFMAGLKEYIPEPNIHSQRLKNSVSQAGDRQRSIRTILQQQEQKQEKVTEKEETHEQEKSTTMEDGAVQESSIPEGDALGEKAPRANEPERSTWGEPIAFMNSNQEFHFFRKDGEQIRFSEAENRAWRKLIKSLNSSNLRD